MDKITRYTFSFESKYPYRKTKISSKVESIEEFIKFFTIDLEDPRSWNEFHGPFSKSLIADSSSIKEMMKSFWYWGSASKAKPEDRDFISFDKNAKKFIKTLLGKTGVFIRYLDLDDNIKSYDLRMQMGKQTIEFVNFDSHVAALTHPHIFIRKLGEHSHQVKQYD